MTSLSRLILLVEALLWQSWAVGRQVHGSYCQDEPVSGHNGETHLVHNRNASRS
jgi:hypothetical protein